MLRCSDANGRIAPLNAVKAFAALPFILLSAHMAHAQNPTIEGNIYYYTDTATINTDITGNDVVIGKLPDGDATSAGDTNIGTDDATKYTVTIADGANTSTSSGTGYFGVQVFNANTINRNGGVNTSIQGFNNSIINVNAGGGSIRGYDNSTVTHNSGGATVRGFGNSIINYITGSGGSIAGLENSTVNVSDGDFSFNCGSNDNSTVNISGGIFRRFFTHDQSIANISNGSFTTFALVGDGSGVTNITGGSFFGADGDDNSVFNISGGLFNSLANPVTLPGLAQSESSVFNLNGTNLSLSAPLGTRVNSGNGLQYTFYRVSGVLLNGDVLDSEFRDYDTDGGFNVGGGAANSALFFNGTPAVAAVVPEAGTLALLGFALVPVGVGFVRRRKWAD